MGTAAVKIKIMPSSPEVNLQKIEEEAKSLLEQEGNNISFEQEPIAFGLKAVHASFGWPEEKGLDDIEEKLRQIEDVNSVNVIDIRRAIG